jgi:hypothetical protein
VIGVVASPSADEVRRAITVRNTSGYSFLALREDAMKMAMGDNGYGDIPVTKIGQGFDFVPPAVPPPPPPVKPPAPKPPIAPTPKPAPTPAPAKKSGCFIATAAYSTPLDPRINVLRQFRDERLLADPLGRAFVKGYYTVSPPIAQAVSLSETLKWAVRGLIAPLVRGR